MNKRPHLTLAISAVSGILLGWFGMGVLRRAEFHQRLAQVVEEAARSKSERSSREGSVPGISLLASLQGPFSEESLPAIVQQLLTLPPAEAGKLINSITDRGWRDLIWKEVFLAAGRTDMALCSKFWKYAPFGPRGNIASDLVREHGLSAFRMLMENPDSRSVAVFTVSQATAESAPAIQEYATRLFEEGKLNPLEFLRLLYMKGCDASAIVTNLQKKISGGALGRERLKIVLTGAIAADGTGETAFALLGEVKSKSDQICLLGKTLPSLARNGTADPVKLLEAARNTGSAAVSREVATALAFQKASDVSAKLPDLLTWCSSLAEPEEQRAGIDAVMKMRSGLYSEDVVGNLIQDGKGLPPQTIEAAVWWAVENKQFTPENLTRIKGAELPLSSEFLNKLDREYQR